MRVIELGEVPERLWTELEAGESQPWGGAGEELQWRAKERHVGIEDDDGRLLALAGLVRARVAIEAHGELGVIGIGGVIITREHRGTGLARPLLARTLELAGGHGEQLAMLFCGEQTMGLYAKFGFAEIDAPVHAEQPGQEVEIPQRAMWLALAPGAQWPPGAVRVLGLPF
jgi:predicted GNAT family N-acyltransferase